MTRYLARWMKPDQKQSLGRTILGRIGKFIITMDEIDFVVAEHWIDKAKEQCAGQKTEQHGLDRECVPKA
jgi:hypothetical protein